MRDYRRPEVYPPLPDIEAGDDEYLAHPDGRPWRKACAECAFRTSDPQGLGDGYQRMLSEPIAGAVFYCVHRADGEHNRICACWAAFQARAASRPAALPNTGGGE